MLFMVVWKRATWGLAGLLPTDVGRQRHIRAKKQDGEDDEVGQVPAPPPGLRAGV